MSAHEPHPTTATVQATLEGLERYLKSELENLNRRIDPLKDVPVKLERLAANQEALADRVKDLEDDKEKSSNKFLQWVTISVAILIGVGTIIINILQVTHG